MKTLLFIAGLLAVLPHSGFAAGAVVQSKCSALTTGNISLAFANGNAAADTIILGVRNAGSVSVSNIADTVHNTYTLIGSDKTGTTLNDGQLSMYRAFNIAAGANTVTITFSGSAGNGQLCMAEVSGLTVADPYDVSHFAHNSSAGTSLDSGATSTTTQANDYIVGMATSVAGNVTAWTAGTNYTLRASAQRPAYEDRNVTSAGTYNATFTISPSLPWVAAVAAFKVNQQVSQQAPAITSANSTTFTIGMAGTFTVTATGTPTPTLSESGTLPNGVSFNSSTGALSGTPAAGTAGTYPITFTADNGVGSDATQSFSLVVAAVAASAAIVQSKCSALTTGNISLAFANGNGPGNTVILGVRNAGSISVSNVADTVHNTYTLIGSDKTGTTSNDGQLSMYRAFNIGVGANTVTIMFSGSAGNGQLCMAEVSGLTVADPYDVSHFAHNSSAGTSLDSGATPTTTQANEYIVGMATSVAGNVTTWTAGTNYTLRASAERPAYEDRNVTSAGTYNATFTISPSLPWVAAVAAFKVNQQVNPQAPAISSLSPTSGPISSLVTIQGANFGMTQGTSTVTFNGILASPTSWSTTQIVAPVPSGATTGSVFVTVGGVSSNPAPFAVVPTPNISSLSPASGPIGTLVTIAGTNFGTVQGAVSLNGTAAPVVSWSPTSIMAAVPTGAASGSLTVTAGGVTSNGVSFTLLPLQLPTQASVLAAIEAVNNFWIPNNGTIVIPGEVPGNADWDQATYFLGDLAAYDATGQANYLSFAQSWASQNSYGLLGGNKTTDADYQAAGQAYVRLYQLSNTKSDLNDITTSIDGMVNSTQDNEWTWVDALNMAMPDFAELGSINNDTSYYTKLYALYSYSKYTLGLYDSTTGLWWRDSSYVGTTTYWSRGDGWAFAAHAKVLAYLPQSDPHYAEYLSTFIAMAQSLAARQQPGGYWDSGLGATDYPGPESSGTSLFLYGLAWGLNSGVLTDRSTYLPVVEKAWNFFVNTAIQPSGLLGYVQNSPACNCPGPTTATTTYDYGVGTFLLGAQQMAILSQTQ